MTVYVTVIAVRHRRTLKLAVSHKEINGINWFLMCPSSRMAQVFLIFGTMVDNSNIEKLTALFSRKIHFCPNLGKKAQNGPQNRVLDFF